MKLSLPGWVILTVAKMGRTVSVIRRCTYFLTDHSVRQVIQPLVLSHLDYCSVVWSSANKKVLQKLQLVQNKASCLALHCSSGESFEGMHDALSWLKVEDRLLSSLLVFFRNICTLSKPKSLHSKILYIDYRHGHTTRQVTKGHVVEPTPTNCAMQRKVSYRLLLEYATMLKNNLLLLLKLRVFCEGMR